MMVLIINQPVKELSVGFSSFRMGTFPSLDFYDSPGDHAGWENLGVEVQLTSCQG